MPVLRRMEVSTESKWNTPRAERGVRVACFGEGYRRGEEEEEKRWSGKRREEEGRKEGRRRMWRVLLGEELDWTPPAEVVELWREYDVCHAENEDDDDLSVQVKTVTKIPTADWITRELRDLCGRDRRCAYLADEFGGT
jgi:hypothetical protein